MQSEEGGSPVLAEGRAAGLTFKEGGVLLPVETVEGYVFSSLLPVVLAVLVGAEEHLKR